ncbi:hypothetical protein MRX96_032624 [Rhipicephalus microplus]
MRVAFRDAAAQLLALVCPVGRRWRGALFRCSLLRRRAARKGMPFYGVAHPAVWRVFDTGEAGRCSPGAGCRFYELPRLMEASVFSEDEAARGAVVFAVYLSPFFLPTLARIETFFLEGAVSLPFAAEVGSPS